MLVPQFPTVDTGALRRAAGFLAAEADGAFWSAAAALSSTQERVLAGSEPWESTASQAWQAVVGARVGEVEVAAGAYQQAASALTTVAGALDAARRDYDRYATPLLGLPWWLFQLGLGDPAEVARTLAGMQAAVDAANAALRHAAADFTAVADLAAGVAARRAASGLPG